MSERVSKQVKNLMQEDSLYCNDDRALLLRVWRDYGLELSTAQKEQFRSAPSAMSIIRRRQEWSKIYPANPVVTAKRRRQEDKMVEEYSKGFWFKRLIAKRHL